MSDRLSEAVIERRNCRRQSDRENNKLSGTYGQPRVREAVTSSVGRTPTPTIITSCLGLLEKASPEKQRLGDCWSIASRYRRYTDKRQL